MSFFKKANPHKENKDTYGQDMSPSAWKRSKNEQFWEGFGQKNKQSYNYDDGQSYSSNRGQSHSNISLKTYAFFLGLILVGMAIFLPIWEVDGFKGQHEAGWKTIKKYFEQKAADKESYEYYKNARENLKKLKEEKGIKDTEKVNINPNTEVVTVKNQIVEKYKNDSEGWREKIAKEKGLPISYINDIIDSKTYLSKENIKKNNNLLKPYSIEILRNAGDVLDRKFKYNPKQRY